MSDEGYDWAQELEDDARVMASLTRRERVRQARLRELDTTEDLQALMNLHPHEFAKLRLKRRALLEQMLGKGWEERLKGKAPGQDTLSIKHRQEGHIPEALVTAYDVLWVKSYGTDAAFIGDPNSLTRGVGGKAVGKGNQMRMSSSDEKLARAGASGKGGGAGSRKSIIKDERAFEFKRKMDKRMRRMAVEIDHWLRFSAPMDKGSEDSLKCSGCKRYCERDWRFCARCGASL